MMLCYLVLKNPIVKNRNNVPYKGAIAWNSLSVAIRKSQTYSILKDLLNVKLIAEVVPARDC